MIILKSAAEERRGAHSSTSTRYGTDATSPIMAEYVFILYLTFFVFLTATVHDRLNKDVRSFTIVIVKWKD